MEVSILYEGAFAKLVDPMNIGLQAWGSDGDVRPMIALAGRLVSRGHKAIISVTSVDDTDYRPLCSSLGVELRLAPDKTGKPLQDFAKVCGRGKDPVGSMRRLLHASLCPYLDCMYEIAQDLAASCDLLIAHFFAWPLKAAAAKADKCCSVILYWPGFIPTAYRPPDMLPDWPWLYNLEWTWFRFIIDRALLSVGRQFFDQVGCQQPSRAIPDLLFASDPGLTLLPVSPLLWQENRDWPRSFPLCGSFTMPGEETWSFPQELMDFLKDGSPPCYLTLGSPEQLEPEAVQRLLIEGAKLAKVRAIVQLKSRQLKTFERQGDLLFVPALPHQHVFPRCSAIVHHGGAGTTHAVLRAGVPSVVVPLMEEQQSWAACLRRAGLSKAMIPYWKATPQSLAKALTDLSSDEEMRKRCAIMGREASKEDGTLKAAELLEGLG